MKSSFNACSASEFNIWYYNITCYKHVGQQSNGRTQLEGVSQQGAERDISTEALECIWLLWELMSIKCYKTWPCISDNKCTAAIECFREVVREKMCTSWGGCLITPLVRNWVPLAGESMYMLSPLAINAVFQKLSVSYRWKYVHVLIVWLLTPSATNWASLADEINVPAMLLVCVYQ